jgi:hypothetical protein
MRQESWLEESRTILEILLDQCFQQDSGIFVFKHGHSGDLAVQNAQRVGSQSSRGDVCLTTLNNAKLAVVPGVPPLKLHGRPPVASSL